MIFGFYRNKKFQTFKLKFVPEDSPTGYIISCDLEYPYYLHEPHSDYPLVPEQLTVNKDKLSPFAQNLADEQWIPTKNLFPTYRTKKITSCTTETCSFTLTRA